MRFRTPIFALATAALVLILIGPAAAEAQGRGRGNGNGSGGSAPSQPTVTASASIEISLADRALIREFYASHAQPSTESLPPGIRRNLARGKPMPPGIAKKQVPADLRSRITIPDSYEVVEVGLDVLLVEVATGVIHDVLMDAIR